MKITVAGISYVGLSNAVVYAQSNEVTIIDGDQEKVDMINDKYSPFVDYKIEDLLQKSNLNLKATTDAEEAFEGAEYVIIATPTNYEPEQECDDYFDTISVTTMIDFALDLAPKAVILIKSEVPVGFIRQVKKNFATENIIVDNNIFSPDIYNKRILYIP